MLVAKGWSLGVTKYRFVLSIRLHHESLIAQFMVVLLTHSLERKKNSTSLELVNHSLLIL